MFPVAGTAGISIAGARTKYRDVLEEVRERYIILVVTQFFDSVTSLKYISYFGYHNRIISFAPIKQSSESQLVEIK